MPVRTRAAKKESPGSLSGLAMTCAALQVAAWLIQEDLHRSRNSGRYASRQEWVMADKKRRGACLRSTFLQDAVKAVEEYQVRHELSASVVEAQR